MARWHCTRRGEYRSFAAIPRKKLAVVCLISIVRTWSIRYGYASPTGGVGNASTSRLKVADLLRTPSNDSQVVVRFSVCLGMDSILTGRLANQAGTPKASGRQTSR